MKLNTIHGAALAILVLIGTPVAFSGCSQKSSSEEIPAHGKAHATKEQPKEKTHEHVALAEHEHPAAAERPPCPNCGVVISVKEVDVEGKGSGVGVVAGGVAGGLIGNQVGQGTGRDLATIAGVVGGAIAGNTIEKKMKKTKVYEIAVKMESGEERVMRQETLPGVLAGDKVKVEGDHIVRQ